MAKILHGITLQDSDGSNRLRFGFTRLLSSIWLNQLTPFQVPRYRWPFRKLTGRFAHLSHAALTLIRKIDRSAELYADSSSTFGEAVTGRKLVANKELEVQIHLDSVLVYVRTLADVVAAVTPFFYDHGSLNPPTRSLRHHLKWFLVRHPDFDPEYSLRIQPLTDWFEQLAGKDGLGVRDLLIHGFAYIQPSVTMAPEHLRGRVTPALITEQGFTHQDLAQSISTIMDGFCEFLDAFVLHHASRIEAECGWPIVDTTQPHLCELYRFHEPLPSHWLFPVRHSG